MILSKCSILFFSLFILALQGCAAPGVRPEDANIFQAAGNLGSGEFERQTNRKRLNVAQSEQELLQTQARFDALRRNSAALQQQKQQLDREYWLITQKNSKLEKNIQAIQIKNSSDKRKQKAAQRKLNKIRRQAKVVHSQSSAISTKEYRKKIALLNRDIRALEDEYLAD